MIIGLQTSYFKRNGFFERERLAPGITRRQIFTAKQITSPGQYLILEFIQSPHSLFCPPPPDAPQPPRHSRKVARNRSHRVPLRQRVVQVGSRSLCELYMRQLASGTAIIHRAKRNRSLSRALGTSQHSGSKVSASQPKTGWRWRTYRFTERSVARGEETPQETDALC